MAEVSLRKLNKRFDGGVHAVKDVDLHIRDREFVVFVGPSGCGKTTTLRLIAGLEAVTDGEIRIDGASRWKAMLFIIIPVAVPGILSAGIIAFTLSWNEFIYALVFLSSPDQKTVPVGVTSELIRGDVFFWGPLMAGALLGSIPVAIVYSFFVEHYVSGLTGSVKG